MVCNPAGAHAVIELLLAACPAVNAARLVLPYEPERYSMGLRPPPKPKRRQHDERSHDSRDYVAE